MVDTGIKQMIQKMTPSSMDVVTGKVLSANPLKIQLVNDEKIILTKEVLCIPRHLTDYSTTADVILGAGTIDSITVAGEGQHTHGPSGGHGGHTAGTGEHSHPGTEGEHQHHLQTYALTGASLKVYNALKQGETVFLLSFNYGKNYYILDREEN